MVFAVAPFLWPPLVGACPQHQESTQKPQGSQPQRLGRDGPAAKPAGNLAASPQGDMAAPSESYLTLVPGSANESDPEVGSLNIDLEQGGSPERPSISISNAELGDEEEARAIELESVDKVQSLVYSVVTE